MEYILIRIPGDFKKRIINRFYSQDDAIEQVFLRNWKLGIIDEPGVVRSTVSQPTSSLAHSISLPSANIPPRYFSRCESIAELHRYLSSPRPTANGPWRTTTKTWDTPRVTLSECSRCPRASCTRIRVSRSVVRPSLTPACFTASHGYLQLQHGQRQRERHERRRQSHQKRRMSETSGLITPCGFRLQAIATRRGLFYWIWAYGVSQLSGKATNSLCVLDLLFP